MLFLSLSTPSHRIKGEKKKSSQWSLHKDLHETYNKIYVFNFKKSRTQTVNYFLGLWEVSPCLNMQRATAEKKIWQRNFLISTRAPLKVMPPIILCWPTMSGVDVGGMVIEVPFYFLYLSTNIPLHFVAMWQMSAEGQSDKMTSDIEVSMKQGSVTEFLHEERIAPIDTHQCLLIAYRD